jgi:Carboxypeptidase regulatory-like domain
MFVQTIVLMRKNLLCRLLNLFAITLLLFTLGCKRTEIPTTPDPTPINPIGGVVNDAAQVTASVSGIVLDETNAPIANAVVTSGAATTTTNTNGMFIFQNISLSKENGNVTVVKAGYFKGIRSFKTTAGKNHTVRIQLMQRILSGTVNAAAGGTITSNGGATIVFPANVFVTSTGAAYTGVVSVYSRWIDPTAANLPFVIPGDLRGVSTTGVENILETYGMVGAELTDASGNVLKIATGKTATVSFPIPASLAATAPASIVLWHFDEASARWKENGTATKNGSAYTAQVDKFSFWNVDVPNTNFINLDYTLINAATNSPLVSTSTRIKRANGSYGYGITNNTGFVSGLVPKNEALVLEVTAQGACGLVTYSQNIGPFSVNTSLGNININVPASQYINFSGTLLNCNGTPVTNGYVAISANGGYGGYVATNSNGTFSFSIVGCSSVNFIYGYQGTDYSNNQQSILFNGITTAGSSLNLGNISACGATSGPDIYVSGIENLKAKVWKNGVEINLSNGIDNSEAYSVFVLGTDVFVAGREKNRAKLWKNGVGTYLTLGTNYSYATDIYAVGSDVYVCGYENNTIPTSNYSVPKLWKNGIATTLTLPSGQNSGTASSVYVVGTDVYVVGAVSSGLSNDSKAIIWKNGVHSLLNSSWYSGASSVFVVGSDVYVAGSKDDGGIGYYTPVYWKNGILNSLESNTNRGGASSIFVFNNDIYVAGNENYYNQGYVSKYWKNQVSYDLTPGAGANRVSAYSIFVKDNNVYAVGTDWTNSSINGKLWKNGIETNFFNTINGVLPTSIFVK